MASVLERLTFGACIGALAGIVGIALCTPEWLTSSAKDDDYSILSPYLRCEQSSDNTTSCDRWGRPGRPSLCLLD